jgi:hypothetical protein
MGFPSDEFYVHVTVTETNFLSFPSEREFLHRLFKRHFFRDVEQDRWTDIVNYRNRLDVRMLYE